MIEGAPGPSTVRPGALTALLGELARAPEASGWSVPAVPGETIGRFEIVREIGRGAFGVVYEARDTELGRSVAFKAIRAGATDAAHELRALAEAEAAARLAHPNIVHLYDVGRCDRGAFLIMELLRGETLDERIARGPLKLCDAVHVAAEISRGLAHAHEQGVVHRDLKPGNVFLCEDGQVKVLDFGLAHVFGQGGLSGGTPAYMAPEQARGEPSTERADVYALGVILHELVTTKRPFEEGARGIPSGEDPPALPGAPTALARLVARMLAREPAERPASGTEAQAELVAIRRSLEPKRLLWAGISIAAAAILGAGVFAYLWQRPPPPGRLVTVLADTENATGDPDLDGVSELIRAGLGQSRRVALVGRSRLVGLLREARGGLPSRIDEGAARATARRAQAQLLVVSSIHAVGHRYDVDLRAVDVTRDESLFSLRESAGAKLTIPAALDRLLARARAALHEEPAQAPRSPVTVETFAPTSPDALRFYTEGVRLRSEGRNDDALEPLKKSIAADPDFLLPRLAVVEDALWTRSGARYIEGPEMDAQLSALRRGLHRLPAMERAYVDYLVRAEWTNLTEELQLLDRVIEASPDDPRPYMLAANAHLMQRADAEAGRPYVEKANALVPYDQSVPELVDFLLAIDRPDEALDRARRTATETPCGDSLAFLAEVHRARGEIPEALRVAREGAARFHEPIPIWVFADADALEEAERLFSDTPRHEPTWRWLALRGRIREAVKMREARLHGRALSGRRLHDFRFFEGFAILSREDAGAIWQETEQLFRLGSGPTLLACNSWKLAAIGDVERARLLDGQSIDRHLCGRMSRAIQTWKRGEREAAIGLLSEIAVPSTHLYRGEILSELGRDREAVEQFRVFRRRRGFNAWDDKLDPYHYPRSLYLEAVALDRLGERDAAREVLGRFLHLWERADPELPLLSRARSLATRLATGRTP